MEALRIKLTQSTANYRKEDTNINKMTYPLPPFSTVIGAIHNACGYREYKEMDVSIQGTYKSLMIEPYTDYCFLNSVMDDRGILVKLKTPNGLSTAFDKVAKAMKSQGNSFRKGDTIQVYNEKLIKEYRDLKDLNDKLDVFKKERMNKAMNLIKLRKKNLTGKMKKLEGKDKEKCKNRLDEIKALEKSIKEKFDVYKEENYSKPYSRFASLTTSLKYYEVLSEVELIIHIKAENEILKDIGENIYNLKSIGRSEDFVDVKEAKIVELYEEVDGYDDIVNKNFGYVNFDLVKEDIIIPKLSDRKKFSGTKYYLNKNYNIINKKRVFEKKKVLCVSEYSVADLVEDVFFDKDGERNYIVNFM